MNKFLIPGLLALALGACEVKTDENVTPPRSYTRNTQTFAITSVESDTIHGRRLFKSKNKNGSFDVELNLWTYKGTTKTLGVALPNAAVVEYDCDTTKLVYTLTDNGTLRQTEADGKAGDKIKITTTNNKVTIKFDITSFNGYRMVGEIGE